MFQIYTENLNGTTVFQPEKNSATGGVRFDSSASATLKFLWFLRYLQEKYLKVPQTAVYHIPTNS
jgi:hypothetical protein